MLQRGRSSPERVRLARHPLDQNVLAFLPGGSAGAAARKAGCALAEAVDGWLTLAVRFERPAWQDAYAALAGVAPHHPREFEALARLRLEEHLSTVPPHLKTHGLLLRGPLVSALLERAASAGHDVIVVPDCSWYLPLRARLRLRSPVPVLVNAAIC